MGWGKSTQLGYGLGIMGAKLAAPDKLCVNVMGDSAIGMTGMDIETASRNKIAILTVVFNNGVMGAERDVLKVSDKKYGAMTVGGNYAKVPRPQRRLAAGREAADIVPAIKQAVGVTEGRAVPPWDGGRRPGPRATAGGIVGGARVPGWAKSPAVPALPGRTVARFCPPSVGKARNAALEFEHRATRLCPPYSASGNFGLACCTCGSARTAASTVGGRSPSISISAMALPPARRGRRGRSRY